MKREPDSEVKFNPPPETKFLSVVSSLMLAVVGVVGFWGMFFSPLIKVQTSGDWVRTPCKIVASKIYADAKRNY